MTSKFKRVETAKGKPMRAILKEAFERLKSQQAVAAELGVAQGTISLWLMRCGLEIRTIIVEREPVKEN
jgi:hypothetical protein